MKKALIAISGGVDSSVAALLTKQAGYDCTAATMKLYEGDDTFPENGCCSLADITDARAVANKIGMPYYVFDFTEEFQREVIERFVSGYTAGRTPNPCIDCNRYIKFSKLYKRILSAEFDYIVTGHYARVEHDSASGRWLLKKAVDGTKDQTYVLYAMTQEQLSRTLFPLGELTKVQVRDIARENGFVNAAKRDSQDICFVPDGDYGAFIERHTGQVYSPGDFVSPSGEVLGRHGGIIRYTIGQRRGLGLAMGEPVYVCGKDISNNTVTVGRDQDLFSRELMAKGINLIAFDRITSPIKVKAKIRYSQEEQPAIVEQLDGDTLRVLFDHPQRAIAPGQAVVLYDGDVVLGGGTIV